MGVAGNRSRESRKNLVDKNAASGKLTVLPAKVRRISAFILSASVHQSRLPV
jgi:hypothetical protein